MYRQILIDPRDRDYQQIVWFDQNSTLSTITNRNLWHYGSSVPCASRIKTIGSRRDSFPLASSILRNNIYVDVLFGAEDMSLLRYHEQIYDLLAKGGFILRKWASNKSELFADISSENHGLACNRIIQSDNVSIFGIS